MNGKGDTIQEQIRDVAHDEEKCGGFALQVIRGKDGKPSEVYYTDMRFLRANKDCNVFYYCEDWKKRGKKNVVVYPKFDPNLDWAKLTDEEKNRHASSILFVKSNSRQTYPSPRYAASVKSCEIERCIDDFHLNAINNGFTGSQIVNFNNTLPIWTNASAEQQKYAFMHILGLILGLTDSYDNGGNHIHGTMEKDPSSIMRKYTDLEDHPNDCWDGFSFYDRIDIPQAFPLIADDVSISLSNPSFDNVEYICEGEQIISADAVFNIPTKFLPNTVLLYSISLYNDTKKQQCAYFNDCDSIQYLFEKGNTYTLTVTVKRRDNGYEVAKKDFVINVIDNPMITVTYPESVSVNSFFNMEFESPYGRPNINIIADELIFDQSDENVEAIQESDNLWKIRLLDYGTFHIHYCLGTTSNVIGTLICSIFYRPDYVMNDTSWLEQLEYVAYTPVTGEAVVIPESSSVERVKILSVTIGSDTFLSNRFYGIVDKKYYFNRFFPLYMEHGMMSTEGYMLILEAGSNATYHFPPISDYKYQGNEYVGEGYEILGTDMYEATYTGFYSLYIPEDSLSLDENYFNDNI